MKETKILEFKETFTTSFLKTVSAFANYNGGQIIFGIDDQGNIKGISDIPKTCLQIENSINDNIHPHPYYEIDIQDHMIILNVMPGMNKPYLYKSKAYKRNDTSTIAVDSFEYTRLVLEGKRISYEELKSENQNLSFSYLENKIQEVFQIETFNKDILKTLNLFSNQNGYNNAANILSDQNSFPGVDIVVFGESINIIRNRITLKNMSILEIYDQAVSIYKNYYQYEEIKGIYRERREIIPESAFREALANAIIHRVLDVSSHIQISMYDHRIEIVSPSGLPHGINEEEFISGRLSVLRNPILSYIFYRLHLVELFGTGIPRINESYNESSTKPVFQVSENTIQIVLPEMTTINHLNNDEKQIYDLLSHIQKKSISEIVPYTSFGRSKVTMILKSLNEKGIVKITGKGKATRYSI